MEVENSQEQVGEEQTQDASSTPTQDNAQAKPQTFKFKLKVDGKEEEAEYSQEQLIKELQMAKSSTKRYQEAQKLISEAKIKERDIQEMMEEIKSNPWSAADKLLKQQGYSLRDIAEMKMVEELKEAAMSPEEKQAEQDRKDAEAYRQWKKQQQEEEENKKRTEAETKQTEALKNNFAKILNEALTSPESKLPANPRTVAKMAQYLKGAIQNGIRPDPGEIAEAVYEDLVTDFQHFAKDATPEQILSLIGEDAFKKLKSWDIAKIQGGTQKPQQPAKPAQAPQRHGKKRYQTIEESRLKEFGSLYVFPED